jgi:hypothetical protein
MRQLRPATNAATAQATRNPGARLSWLSYPAETLAANATAASATSPIEATSDAAETRLSLEGFLRLIGDKHGSNDP